jgi:hypothetical protein
MIDEKTAKRKSPIRRGRLNKDWPIKVYTYDCWPQEKPPQALWDTAHEMRRLWNDFTAIFRKILADDKKDEAGKPLLSKEERAILWAPINTKPLREIAKQRKEKLDAGCREAVVVRFLTTVGNWRKNPSRVGPPRFKRADDMNAISIPLVYNDGKSAEWLNGGEGTSSIRDTRNLKTEAPEEYLNNGHFCVGITRERLNLHVAYGGRSGRNKYYLPAECRIKQVALCGRRDSAFSWSWSFQVRLEHPPDPARRPTGRVCGWDSGGWRLMDGYIRLGVIADNAGHFYELMVPLVIGAASRRMRREKEYCHKHGWEYSKPMTFDDAEALDASYGATLEACKTEVCKIFEEEKEDWPADAGKIMSRIVKMRDMGLRRLRRKLEQIESEAKRTIDEWDAEAAKMNETIRAFEIHAYKAKRDAYRQIAAWLNAFDIIAWEGDLSLKQMAEQVGKKKQKRKEAHKETGQWNERTPEELQFEASQKYRQIAGQHGLREFVKQKHKSRLQNEKAAYSTQTCPECGGAIEPGHKLLLVCENGHGRDQDVTAALHFLNKIEGVASIMVPPVEIPAHLRPYLRVMDASEARLELAEKL